MRQLLATTLLSLALALGANAQAPPPAGGAACAALTAPMIPAIQGATIVSVQAAERRQVRVNGQMINNQTGLPQPIPALDICDVNVTLTHGTSNDRVRVEVWMPLKDATSTRFNDRFQATGGGGFVAGTFGNAMAPQVAVGFASASTDAGIPANSSATTVLNNAQLLDNFSRLSVHEMALVGKALVEAFYGRAPNFSYWNGCSTGGRQGYGEAENFPDDFDGILAVAPAVNLDRFGVANLWPLVVAATTPAAPGAPGTVNGTSTNVMPQCVLNAMRSANVAACDNAGVDADGVVDGIISNPFACTFNATTAVGQVVPCNATQGGTSANGTITITVQHATAYTRVLEGPSVTNGTRLWYGYLPGTNFNAPPANNTQASWANNMFVQQTNLTTAPITVDNFAQVFSRAIINPRFGSSTALAAENPDLSRFRASGGKLLTWHGLVDQVIFPEGTLDYHQRVQTALQNNIDDFYRVFLAPGVAHCGGGTGPVPVNPIDSLVAWVERGVAPETLPAVKVNSTGPANEPSNNGTVARRNLCRVGFSPRFTPGSPVNDAASWTCQVAQRMPQLIVGNQTTTTGPPLVASSAVSTFGNFYHLVLTALISCMVAAFL